MTKTNAQSIYESIQKECKFNNNACRISMGQPDAIVKPYLHKIVEDVLRKWLEGWLKNNDIYLDPDDKTHELLEVKAFNYDATPGFDIADFKAYIREIVDKPYMLHHQYLIFGYRMSNEGIVTIQELWLKNVWEITRSSEKWAVNVQYKNKIINKIRPSSWYSKQKSQYPCFQSLEHFLSAIEETIYTYPDTRQYAVGWKEKMEKSYAKFYGKKISIPRWMDIEAQYRLSK